MIPVSRPSFTFATPVASGSVYSIAIHTQPIGQTCNVAGGSGFVGAGDVTTAIVNCTANMYAVGGTITGLVGTVVLQQSGGDSLTLNSAGTFAFPTPIASGSSYFVTVLNQPSTPSQTCVIASGAAGTVVSEDIASVSIACTTNVYTVGGLISGLAGTVTLQNLSLIHI